ncbi:hypothetical protein [Chryseobacterium sp.]|uniref:hypothetical protein n=1 Tax=Chryseobacterium sp. TaxID=1871047 RepID=UPI0024E1F299|nr:hypothetical protein [Chryseobacterium sp.]
MENKNPENTEILSVKERLIKFINHENLSQSKFEKKANLSNGYVNNIKNSISDKIFDYRIHPAFPHLNKIWLFHGIGEMITKTTSESTSVTSSSIKNKPLDEQMEILQDEIKYLKEENDRLSDKIDDTIALIELYLSPIALKMEINIDPDLKKKILDHLN